MYCRYLFYKKNENEETLKSSSFPALELLLGSLDKYCKLELSFWCDSVVAPFFHILERSFPTNTSFTDGIFAVLFREGIWWRMCFTFVLILLFSRGSWRCALSSRCIEFSASVRFEVEHPASADLTSNNHYVTFYAKNREISFPHNKSILTENCKKWNKIKEWNKTDKGRILRIGRQRHASKQLWWSDDAKRLCQRFHLTNVLKSHYLKNDAMMLWIWKWQSSKDSIDWKFKKKTSHTRSTR